MREGDLPMQDRILGFWFGPRDAEAYGTTRDVWFRKDAAFDASVRKDFGAAVDQAIEGAFAGWIAPNAALARVLLLDQFTRNIYRDTPHAFAGDALALRTAEDVVARGDDAALLPVERWFLYMPFEHAESAPAQERSVELFTRLAQQTGLAEPLDWAHRHASVIRRFGRYPHRNAILGRESSVDETAFLAQPGSGF